MYICDLKKYNNICVWLRISEFLNEYIATDYTNSFDNIFNYITDIIKYIIKFSTLDVSLLTFELYDPMMYNLLNENKFTEKTQIITKINNKIFEEYKNNIRLNFIDINRIIANCGISNSYSKRYYRLYGNPYSKKLIENIKLEIEKRIEYLNHKNPKCIIVDGDNVLWKGIASEDGISMIKLDDRIFSIYKEFQSCLFFLCKQGIILTLCTQNDLEDIKYIFDNKQFIIKYNQFVSVQAGWEPKINKIERIHEELDISYDEMIFIDDSIFEIEQIKFIHPEMSTILFSEDIFSKICLYFKINNNIGKIYAIERMKTYMDNSLRIDLKRNSQSYEEYLQYLNTEIKIELCDSINYSRISELSQRTNRCTNGIRLSYDNILNFVLEDYKLYEISAVDIFSNYGIVGALLIKADIIILLCLSCRVINRGLEEKIINYAIDMGANKIKYKETGKNEDFFNFITNYLVIDNE